MSLEDYNHDVSNIEFGTHEFGETIPKQGGVSDYR